MSWAATEFESLDLGDPRRNRRAIRLMEKLSAKPTASIPGACGDWADTIGAYRFFNNEEVEWPAILAPHIQNSVTRMAAHDVVLCIQDTTELDFNGQMASGLTPVPAVDRGFQAYQDQQGRPAYHLNLLLRCR